jgi:hypothetical protein
MGAFRVGQILQFAGSHCQVLENVSIDTVAIELAHVMRTRNLGSRTP